MDNKLLISEVKKGNQKVINDTYRQYRNQFIAFAYKKYNLSGELAKEIYEESFVAFYKNVINEKLVNLDVDLKTYLFQIGRNLINNEFRRTKRIDKTVEVPNLRVVDENVTESEMNHDLVKKAIRESIEELNESCLKLLTMFYFERLKYEDIMEVTEYKTVDSIKTQKYKCFKKLEAIIKSKYKKEHFFN